jgi:hypothetical protein
MASPKENGGSSLPYENGHGLNGNLAEDGEEDRGQDGVEEPFRNNGDVAMENGGESEDEEGPVIPIVEQQPKKRYSFIPMPPYLFYIFRKKSAVLDTV